MDARGRLDRRGADGAERVAAHALDLGRARRVRARRPAARAGLARVRARHRRRAGARRAAARSARAWRSPATCRAAPACPPRPRWRSRWPRAARARGHATGEIGAHRPRASCARAWRTTGRARRPGCSTSWPRCTASADTALRIDFQTLRVEPVPLRSDGWRLVTLDSGERHENASSGYNERREECARACELLGVRSLREAEPGGRCERLPDAAARARAARAQRERARGRRRGGPARRTTCPALARLLNASHASLRDDMEISTPAVEAAVGGCWTRAPPARG